MSAFSNGTIRLDSPPLTRSDSGSSTSSNSSPRTSFARPPHHSRHSHGYGCGFMGFPVLDGAHTPQNVAIYAAAMGLLIGLGLAVGAVSARFGPIGLFIASLAMFHLMEYISTAMYRRDVTLQSFLFNHSPQYHFAMSACVVEFVIESFFWPNMKRMGMMNLLGFVIVVSMQIIRSAAMITAGSNFTHLIAERREKNHVLITNGVYSVFRHPSYTSFFYWGIGMTVMLWNPICFVGFIAALWTFFNNRIRYEEGVMSQPEFFGEAYRQYRQRTFTFIPLIP